MSKNDYSSSYSEDSFWNKITKMPENTGCAVLRSAFTLYALLRESSTPLWAKTAILGSLIYFINPLDLLPDFLILGYTDDLAMMTIVLGQAHAFMDDDIQNKVESMLPEKCRGKYGIEPTYKS